jgi:tetratricopeptide (TPR) repeat protein
MRRQRLLREAEGYLDLIMMFADQWPLRRESSDRLAVRTVRLLEGVNNSGDIRGYADYLRGQAYRVMECYREAIDHLRKAAEHDPTNVHIHLALGWCYKRTGRLDLAIQSLQEGLAIDPDQGIVHYNLACYWSLAENARQALKHLAQSMELDPTYRELVGKEPDFDPIRDDPDFVALTSPTTSL